ncbi:MAG: Cna B-type domain-containing protein [Christensenellales bacterium]
MIRVKTKRFIALLLAVLMMWQIVPVQMLAETISDGFSLMENLGIGVRGGPAVYHTVYFDDWDDTRIRAYDGTNPDYPKVLDGTPLDSIAPPDPTRTGYTFVQWTPPETYITGDVPATFTFTAQYRSTDLYELKIDYKYENGSPAALSYLATLAYGEDYEVTSPAIQGFYVDPAADEIISGTAGTSQGGATELNYTVTYKATTGTPYTVEHYQQNVNNDEYIRIGTETEVFYATTGSTVTVNSKNFPGFTAKTPTQQATIAADGSTVVKMYYDRISYILTFDTAGGNFIPPFQGRYGATVPTVANPTRTGYTFAGWSAPIPVILTESQTITAHWTALSNINYTLIYWLENADPIPGTTTYEYSYYSTATRTGTAGTVITLAMTDQISIDYFTYSHYDTGRIIAGDGSTVVNIYYTRNSYTVEFNLRWAGATLTIGGKTYTDKKPYYSFTAKYQSDISALWPTVEHISPPGLYEFTGWYITATGKTWVTKQTRLTDELIHPNPNVTRTFRADWSLIIYPYDLHYMFESLDGTGEYYDGDGYGRYYKQDEQLSGLVYAAGTISWPAKEIPGLTNVGKIQDYLYYGDGDYDVYFYYTRNIHILDFQSHGQVVPGRSQSLMYGASILPGYNFTPATPSDLPGYSFGGWYTTSACTPGTEFVWAGATMPAQNLRLFAKWVPPEHTVRYTYTKPDGAQVQHAAQQVVQGQKAVRPDDPAAIPGYDFDGWYYVGTTTKYSFDAQVFSNLDLTGRYLPKNDRTYTVQYLYTNNSEAFSPKTATGQTMGATVTEQAANVPNHLPDALSKTLTLAAEDNVITFYYSVPNVNYTVRYLERDTGMALLPPVTKSSEGQTTVTEMAPSITNKPYQMPDNSWVIVDFNPDMPEKSLTLTSNPDLNIITFYYEYVIKHHYEVRYLEIGTNVELAQLKHVITAKSEVVELAKTITNYRPHSVVSTYPNLVRSSSANYISTKLGVVDPVSQPAQVITFYYAPAHIDITGTKTWVDQGIETPDQRPGSLTVTLYANNVQLTPQPVPTWTNEGDTWTYTYINLPAAAEGVPKYYTVRETVPNNYVASHVDKDAPGGTNITNTLDGGTTTFSGTKVWVDTPDPVSGYNPRPATLVLTFYRKGQNDANWVKMSPQPSYSWDKTTGDNTWTYTATSLKKYEDGHLVAYKAEETLPLGYEKTIDDGQHFKNEVIYTKATKTWVNGPDEHPTIWLQVHRQVGAGTPVPVPLASLKKLESGTTEVQWRGLEQTDANGNPYIFSVREVNAEGQLWTPPNYTKEESSLNVTNTYVIPTDGTATGTKTWVNGAATHPDLWLQLWRKIDLGNPNVDVDMAVPDADVIKVSETGNTSHEWTGLETTDINGNAYTFYIKEGQWDGATFTEGVPANYTCTGTGTLNLTNTYVIPTNGTFEATKVWVDGAQVDKPAVWFQLHRRVANGAWAPVTGTDIKQVPTTDPFTVTWEDLEETDSAARPYEFGVLEGVYNEGTQEFSPGSPSPFDTSTGEYTDEITNTYVSPKRDDIIVSKVFKTTCPKGVAPVTEVILELWRKVGTKEGERVGNPVSLDGNIDAVEFYPWKAKFTDLDDTDENGNTYTYWVKEPVVPGNYVDTYNQETFTVTNTWQGVPFTAKKEWAGGYTNMPRPPVSFQLQRKTANMEAPENVGNPVTLDGIPDGGSLGEGSGEHTAWTYTWESLPKHDNDNNLYIYSVTEKRLIGYTPSDPVVLNDIPTITNTFEGVSVSATKRIVIPKRYSGTTVNPPPFSLTLYRNGTAVDTVILNGVADTQGGAGNDALKPDGSGETAPSDVKTDGAGNTIYQWHYTWNNLPENDENGEPYTYTVGEPDVPLNYVRMSVSEESGVFVITNEYNDGTFRAHKEWDTRTGKVPVTFQLQYVTVDDPENWQDMTLDISLNGIADSEEGHPNGTVRYEDTPWRAVWTGLPAQVDGVNVKYRVQEVFDDALEGNYENDTTASASTVITNTSLKANITAKKVWVGGETVRPASITMSLSRYFEGGTTKDTGYKSPAAATLTKPEDNNNDWGTHTWENQERFYTDQGVQKEYVYKVTETSLSEFDPEEGGFEETSNTVVDGVHTITNTHTPPTRDYYMKKAWDGGKPRAVTVQLQRKYADEEDDNAYIPMGPGHTLDGVEDTDYGEFSNAKELENWVLHRPDLVRADNTGRAYKYRIIELSDLSEYGFTSYSVVYNGTEYDAVVTNHYEIPTDGEATVKKVWVNGAEADRPDVWFQLWRKTTTGTDDVREKVPGSDPLLAPDLAPIKINDHVGYEYTFTDLAKTDKYANAYTFFVVEGSYDGTNFTAGNPENYELTTTGDSLTLTNSYVIPTTGTVTATKEWVNGPADKPEVWFQLHRKTGTGSWEIVPGAEIKQVPVVPAELKVEWSGLETTDINGNAYEFGVVEGSYKNNTFTAGAPENYTATAQPSLAITNTYVSPKREDIIVSKSFKTTYAGGIAPVTPVTLKLWRQAAGTPDAEEVGEVELDGNIGGLEHNAWQAKFTNLDATDENGDEYDYWVDEPSVPGNYAMTIDDNNPFTVINTWQTTSYTVNKVWAGGYTGMEHPSVQLQLWRQSEGMAEREKVPLVGLVTLPATTENQVSYPWENLPLKDANNKPYEYTVSEVTGLVGYTVSQEGNTITNTYKHVDINAKKVIEFPDGVIPSADDLPFFTLVLHCSDGEEHTAILDGIDDNAADHESGERAPDTPGQDRLTWNYSWKYLPKHDAQGNEFVYTLTEPNPPSGYVRQSITGDMNDGFIVTNEHRHDVFRAFKYWDTKTGTKPVIFRLEQVTVNADGDPDGTWTDMGMNIELDGVADNSNANYYEDSPWRAVWTNLPTQVGGVTVKYRVQEIPITPADDYDTVTSASTAIKNTSLKTDITAAKKWVNGEEVRPENITLTLKRYKEEGGTLIVDPDYEKTTTLSKPAGNEDNWGEYTWNEDRFYTDGQGERQEYVYKVTESYDLLDPDNPGTEGSFTSEYEVINGVHTVTNTYVQPTVDMKAAKVWDGGDASNRPAVTFQLWRKYASEGDNAWVLAMPGAVGHTLDGVIDQAADPQTGVQEYEPWKIKRDGVPMRDTKGEPYVYRIAETERVTGFEEPEYTGNETQGFVVTNKYIIPTTGTATATKVFEQGENAVKPDVWFQLWRKTTGGAVDGGQAVPGIDPVNITAEPNYTYTFDNLETTDSNAKPYTFYVKEGNYNENTKIFTDATVFGDFSYQSGGGTLTLINRYASPATATASATKKWVGGPSANQTGIDLTLYRKTTTGTDEEVPAGDQGTPTKGGNAPDFTYSWTGLKNTDPQGNPYTYYVREPNVTDGKISIGEGDSKADYVVDHADDDANNKTTITNTYVSPTLAPLTVGKDWSFPQGVDGDLYKTEITLSLMRSPEGSTATPEKVRDIVLNGIAGGDEQQPWRSTIQGLPERNEDGVKYIYSVAEDVVPGNYVMTIDEEDPFTVINTWQTTNFTARKIWSDPAYEGQQRPEITFQLQRSTDGLTFESVGDPVTISSEPWTYTWTNLPKYSPTKKLYTYTFTETRVAGYTPSAVELDADGLGGSITNTYEGVSVKATKRIVIPKRYGTVVILPLFGFTLYRSVGEKTEVVNSVILNGVADMSGGTGNDALKPDGSGETAPEAVTIENGNTIHQWRYTWKNLPKYDENGDSYTYTVGEPVVPPLYVRTGETGDAEDGFVITNEYNDGTFRAEKEWDTKTGTVPVTFRLERATASAPDVWEGTGKNIVLNGTADSEENNPNNPDYYEYSPWRALWKGLPAQVNGVLVRYRVQETAPDGYDAVSSASTVITNISQNTDITAAVAWENGEEVRPGSVTLVLNRYLNDGTTADPAYTIPIEETLLKPANNADNWEEHTWEDQPRYYKDNNNERQEYVYKVTEKPFTLDSTQGSFKSECEVVNGVHTITNTYEQPFDDLKAAKVWDGGDASNRPAVTIRLWRKYASEGDDKWAHANPSAPGHTLDGKPEADNHPLTRAREYAPWKMVGKAPLRDIHGKLFEYKITETAAVSGFDEPVYSNNQQVGGESIHYVVTNTYKIPTTGTATATKVFEKGENADKPEIWFQLWRKIDIDDPEVDVDVAVPNVAPVKITAKDNYTHTFEKLETTDFNANPYTFYVKEGVYDEDTETFTPFTSVTVFGDFTYQLGEGTLTLTNRYVIPTNGTATATKTWVNGPDTKPDVWFQLHRKTSTGSWEVVPGADIKKVPTYNSTAPDTKLSVRWDGLEMTDINGNAYAFAVEEGIYDEASNAFTPGAPLHYMATGRMSLAISNTYDPPADASFTATKTWAGGPGNNKTAVAFDLYRKSKNMTEKELVTGATCTVTGEAPKYTCTWDNLISRDSKGDLYTFTVKERDEDAQGYFTAQDGSKYKVSYDEDHKDATNTYQIPRDKDVVATKAWVNGPTDDRPDVWFKLQRRILGVSSWADVPGADIKQVPAQDPQNPNAALSVTWEDQERMNFGGLNWEYAVVEGKLENGVFTEAVPENYELSGEGTLNLTNTYNIPTQTLIAQKQWVNGPTQKPTVWFKLQRALPGGQPEDIPAGEAGSAILKLLPGVLSVQWDNVEQTDIDGKPYSFSIVEGLMNEDTQVFTPGLPDSYEYTVTAMEGSLGVVNTYTSPTSTKTTRKIWAGGGPTPYPSIWLRLERATNPGEGFEAVPDADPIKASMLEGSAESEPITWKTLL